MTLQRIEHMHVTRLEGYSYCWPREGEAAGERLLCYELPRGTCDLDTVLFGTSKQGLLDWETRFRIIRGICQGVQYLHKECPNAPVVGLDLNPAIIWLDSDMVPRLGDFGHSQTFLEKAAPTSAVNAGRSIGHMAPECVNSGIITTKSDIFSLGVLIMEIVTGEKCGSNRTNHSSRLFVEKVQKTWTEDAGILSKDPSLEKGFLHIIKKLITLGLSCVEEKPEKRLTIDQTIRFLMYNFNHFLFYVKNKEGTRTAELKRCRMERMLGITKEPSPLDLPLLKRNTEKFSQRKRGLGGREDVYKAAELNLPERILDGTEEPKHLDLSLLQSITERREDVYKAAELNLLERILAGTEEPKHLDLSLLQSITEKFSETKRIGQGGCGDVYKGILRNGTVAVKRLFKTHTIKDKMFHREVTSLVTARHENIVRFLGYCSVTVEHAVPYQGETIMAEIRERLLCFEFINNGSLDNHLTDELSGLEWQTRYEIIAGICKGLLYLHEEKKIIHMDLKPANILLDDCMVPKIADFGLSRFDKNSQAGTTSRLVSAGYCAPEYLSYGKSSRKSDIYSLGVIITELVTGSINKPNLTKVLRRWRHRWIKSLKHTPLGYQQVMKCLELAQRCTQIDPTDRPDISDIIDELNTIDTNENQFPVTPCLLEDILEIVPLEIHIPFELDEQMSHSIELINDTDDHIAFMTKVRLDYLDTEPDKGIVQPRSKCSVDIIVHTQVNALPNGQHKKITILSSRVDGGLAPMDVTKDMFIDKEGKVVDEVNVTVISGKSPLEEDS